MAAYWLLTYFEYSSMEIQGGIQIWQIFGIGLLLLASAVLLFRDRIFRFLKGSEPVAPYALRQQDEREEDIAELQKLPPSPITRISFQEAMASEQLGGEIEKYCSESLTRALTGDGLNVIVQSVLLSSNELTLVYKFSRDATALFEAGQASIPLHSESGRLLPWMYDKSGRIIEQAKGASTVALRLAQSWALVVSIAHLISGLDVVKRLKDIDRKLSLLVVGRRIDQDAALNRIYTEARGILSQKIDQSVVRELKKYRYDLYQLRQVWCGEISELARSTVLPNRSGWHHSSWWRRGKRENEVVIFLAPIVDKLERLRVALLTDACLAVASGTTQDFFENALPSEQEFWAPVTAQLNEIENRLRKDTPKKQIEGIRTGVAVYTDVLNGLIGRESPISSIQPRFL
jgi:hypothetical protein